MGKWQEMLARFHKSLQRVFSPSWPYLAREGHSRVLNRKSLGGGDRSEQSLLPQSPGGLGIDGNLPGGRRQRGWGQSGQHGKGQLSQPLPLSPLCAWGPLLTKEPLPHQPCARPHSAVGVFNLRNIQICLLSPLVIVSWKLWQSSDFLLIHHGENLEWTLK